HVVRQDKAPDLLFDRHGEGVPVFRVRTLDNKSYGWSARPVGPCKGVQGAPAKAWLPMARVPVLWTKISSSSMVESTPTNAMLSAKPMARPVRHLSTRRATATGSKYPASRKRLS